MNPPFKLPVRIEDEVFIVDANDELVIKTEAGTKEELDFIVLAINNFKGDPSC